MVEIILVAAIAASLGGLRLYTFVRAMRRGDFRDPIGKAYGLCLTA